METTKAEHGKIDLIESLVVLIAATQKTIHHFTLYISLHFGLSYGKPRKSPRNLFFLLIMHHLLISAGPSEVLTYSEWRLVHLRCLQ